jgi:diguanylate cyclase (GGDEF)-like protein
MRDRRGETRHRLLKEATIVFNDRRSAIACLVRNLSDSGACLEVASAAEAPNEFELSIKDETASRHCVSAWRAGNKIGVEFGAAVEIAARESHRHLASAGSGEAASLLRGELLALRAALDEIDVGVVLLDGSLRAQFINQAFRKMWRLPAAKADARPSFAALMHHGADTGAYKVQARDLPAYIAGRIEQVIEGDTPPRDLRLSNGEVLRSQCVSLPSGGRMISYTYVTDIVRQSDELSMLRAAADNIDQGVALLDAELNVQFMNASARRLWSVSETRVEDHPSYVELVGEGRAVLSPGVEGQELDALAALHIAHVRAGSSKPMDLRAADGRVIRTRCNVLPDGGRMLTYGDVTDLAQHADELQALARIDTLTGIPNRRHFLELAEIEWNRFARYERPLSVMMIDIDRFKSINDAYGHQTGDQVLLAVAQTLTEVRRHSDAVGRIGGEEFAILLPETTLAQAKMAAERLVRAVAQQEFKIGDEVIQTTVSIGVAEAWDTAADFAALMNQADQALYRAKKAGRNRVGTVRSSGAIPVA